MLYIISYDVSTVDKAGRTRLRRVAKICENYGQRVQNSVFECEMRYETFLQLRHQLEQEMELEQDSLRIYPLGKSGRDHAIHLGIKPVFDMTGPLIL